MNKKRRLIVLGLDGASFNIIKPLVEDGALPTFKKLLENGAHGELESVIPPITPCAWETAVTGVNPGQHNIFDFFSYRADYEVDILDSSDRAALAVWDYLSKYGKRSIVFNYPMGFPPPKISGIFVSGMNTPGVNTKFTSPEDIKKNIFKKVPNYRIDVLGDHLTNGREDLFFEDVLDLTKKHYQAVQMLLEKCKWDLSLIFFTEPDRVHHYFYHDISKNHPLNKLKKNNKNRILEYYKLLDSMVGELIKKYKNVPFIIFSDHGIEELHKDVFIEEYLRDWGLLKFKKTSKGFLNALFTRFVLATRKTAYLTGIGQKILPLIPGFLFNFIVKASGSGNSDKSNIDWNKTKAYFSTPSSQGLRINLVDRENNGCVIKKDYEKTGDFVIKKLLTIKDPSNGRKVIKNVYKRKQIYSGPYVENAQDLIIETESLYHLQKGIGKGKFGLASESGVPKSAEHGRNGIFIAYGKGVKNLKLNNLKLVDIASYILYILGVSIPRNLEGKINPKIFNEKK